MFIALKISGLETMNIRSEDVSFIVQAPVMSLDTISYDPICNGALDYALRLSPNALRIRGFSCL